MAPVSRTAPFSVLPVSLSRSLPARSTRANLPYLRGANGSYARVSIILKEFHDAICTGAGVSCV